MHIPWPCYYFGVSKIDISAYVPVCLPGSGTMWVHFRTNLMLPVCSRSAIRSIRNKGNVKYLSKSWAPSVLRCQRVPFVRVRTRRTRTTQGPLLREPDLHPTDGIKMAMVCPSSSFKQTQYYSKQTCNSHFSLLSFAPPLRATKPTEAIPRNDDGDRLGWSSWRSS